MTKKIFFTKLFCPLLALFLTLQTPLSASAADFPEGWPAAPEIADETGILMDADSGQVLFDKGMDEKRYPASTTKVMTALLILENIPDLNTKVTFTDVIIPDLEPGNSTINAKVGEELTAEQCLYAIMLVSANEVCTQMAVNIAGSVDKFTAMMNQRAAELGCQNTNFVNANGLPDPNHYTTAHDLAKILAAAVKNENFCKIAGAAAYTIPPTNKTDEPRNMENHHDLLKDGEFRYEGAVAGKTGHTEAAKNTLVTAARRDDMTLVCVVMRSEGTDRFSDTCKLFDYGFDNFHKEALYWIDTENPVGYAILPKSVEGSHLMVSDQDADNIRTRTYSYQGKEIFRASRELPLEIKTPDSAEATAKKALLQVKSLISPAVFPAMMIFLAVLCTIYIIYLIRALRRQKKQKIRTPRPNTR